MTSPPPSPTALPQVIPPALTALPTDIAALLADHNPLQPLPAPPTAPRPFPHPTLIADLAPHLSHPVVAVDPNVSDNAQSDESGIIVAAILAPTFNRPPPPEAPPNSPSQRRAIVLDDATIASRSPADWAARAVDAAVAWGARTIVVEKNQGGDLLKEVLHQAIGDNPTALARQQNGLLTVELVHAYVGKELRAEPVSHLYDQSRVLHLRRFPWLEQQMTTWLPGSRRSPDRLDALVHALAHLLPRLAVRPGTVHGHGRPPSQRAQPTVKTKVDQDTLDAFLADATTPDEVAQVRSLYTTDDVTPPPEDRRGAGWLTRSNMPGRNSPLATSSPYARSMSRKRRWSGRQ